MSEENNLSTYQKALLREQDSFKELAEAKPFGSKLALLEDKPSLLSLVYPGTGAVVLDIHGGGFCFKSVLDNDVYCHYLQEKTNWAILDAAFTLSCHGSYPIQRNEILAELASFYRKWPLYRDLPLFIIGHSSGANLAASVTLGLQGKVRGVLLNYPFLDLAKDPATRPQLPETFPDFLLADWVRLYCPDKALLSDPLVSPNHLSKAQAEAFPPTLITVANHCRLKEDGIDFYQKLQAVSTPSKLLEAEERHGFIERHMRNVYLTPEDPAVINAKEVTDESLSFLSSLLKKGE